MSKIKTVVCSNFNGQLV